MYIDVHKVKLCSVDGVAFHSFIWPTFDVRKVKSIARTLWINYCQWADILIIRGRCWSSLNNFFRSNRVSENLLWHWQDQRRPFVVYKEGNDAIGGGDPIPGWLMSCGYCACGDFCKCKLVGVEISGRPRFVNGQGWHHPGMLYSNSGAVWHKCPQVFRCDCRCSQVKTHHPDRHCNRHTMNGLIAAKLTRTVLSMFAGHAS